MMQIIPFLSDMVLAVLVVLLMWCVAVRCGFVVWY